jgi:hypothetical protein
MTRLGDIISIPGIGRAEVMQILGDWGHGGRNLLGCIPPEHGKIVACWANGKVYGHVRADGNGRGVIDRKDRP